MSVCSHLVFCVFVRLLIVLPSMRAAEISVGNWLEWSSWTTCTAEKYCLEGTRQRRRPCERGKRCVGIEEESEDCPKASCQDHKVLHDVVHSGDHSFIQEECLTPVKYYIKGKYAKLLKHNISAMFPSAKEVIETSFFNIKFTKKKHPSEENIFKYCFEPESRSFTLSQFVKLFATGALRFKYTSIFSPFYQPQRERRVTGFVIGVQEFGDLYAIYAQVTTKNGFHSIHYKYMPGYNLAVRHLIW